MGNRLTRIYTRTGDQGTTALGDGSRVAKDDLRVEVYGHVDELNSQLGLLLAGELPQRIRGILQPVQHTLFELGGELCIPGRRTLEENDVTGLEQALDLLNSDLPSLKEFILPGGNINAARCHVVRTVCRRCERLCTTLSRETECNPVALQYLNRLSDLLFVAARVLARENDGREVLWQRRAPRTDSPQ